MFIKSKLSFPRHLIFRYKKSIKGIVVFWVFSPFGIIKKILSDLFYIKKTQYYLVFYFSIKKRGVPSIKTQFTLLKNLFIGISRGYRLSV